MKPVPTISSGNIYKPIVKDFVFLFFYLKIFILYNLYNFNIYFIKYILLLKFISCIIAYYIITKFFPIDIKEWVLDFQNNSIRKIGVFSLK